MKRHALIVGLGLLALTGCAKTEMHYWQKTDPNASLYLTGVKAQQTLEQDISTCVHEIIELTKLSDVRMKTPEPFQTLGDYDQKEATDGMSRLPRWDVPEYILDLRVDHTDFHDFEGCMNFKGWQRVKYVAPEAERHSKEVYDDTANYSIRPKSLAQKQYEQDEQNIGAER